MRALAAAVVLLVGALLVPVATVGWWMRDTLVPTGAYVATVAPLATDDAVVTAVEDRLLDETMRQLRDAGLLARVSGPVEARVEGVARQAVDQVVESRSFAAAWRASNRVAHNELVAVLSGSSAAVRVRPDSTVEIRVRGLASALRRELVAAGVPFAGALPAVQVSLPIGDVADVARAQRGYQLLDSWGRLLPVAALLVVAAGSLLARHRLWALAWTAFAALLGLVAVALGLLVGRTVYLASLPSDVPAGAARAVFDTVTAGLRRDLLLVAAGALVVMLLSAALGRRGRG